MAQALPVAKLVGLLIKTAAKPVSKRIKHEFSRTETGQRFLIKVGQFSHSFTSRLTIWSAGYKVRSIKPLEDELALTLGAEVVGESFLLFVSTGWLLYEYDHSVKKSSLKEEKERAKAKADRDELRRKLHAIDVRLVAIEEYAKQQSAFTLTDKYRYHAPDQRKIVPIVDDDDDNDDVDDKTEPKVESVNTPETQVLSESSSFERDSNVNEAAQSGEPPQPQEEGQSQSSTPWWRKWLPW